MTSTDLDTGADDGRDLFAAADRVQVPDLWPEIRARAPVADRRRGRVAAVVALVATIAGIWGVGALLDDDTRDVAIGRTGDAADLDGADITVIVWMEPDATDDELDAVAAGLDADDRVVTVRYSDQEASFDEFAELFAERPEMVETVAPEDLPSSYRVGLQDAGATERFIVDYTTQPGVYDVTTPWLGVTIRMDPGVTGDELDRTARRLGADERAAEVVFVGPVQAAIDLERRFTDRSETMRVTTTDDDAPPSFRVSLVRPVDPERFASDYRPLAGVDDVDVETGEVEAVGATSGTGPDGD